MYSAWTYVRLYVCMYVCMYVCSSMPRCYDPLLQPTVFEVEAFNPAQRVDASGVPSKFLCMTELEEATRAWRRELTAEREAKRRKGHAPFTD